MYWSSMLIPPRSSRALLDTHSISSNLSVLLCKFLLLLRYLMSRIRRRWLWRTPNLSYQTAPQNETCAYPSAQSPPFTECKPGEGGTPKRLQCIDHSSFSCRHVSHCNKLQRHRNAISKGVLIMTIEQAKKKFHSDSSQFTRSRRERTGK